MAAHTFGGAMRKIARPIMRLFPLFFVFSSSSFAHGGQHDTSAFASYFETSQMITAFGLIVLLFGYIAGTRHLWKHAGRGHGIAVRSVSFFALGWLSLVVALIGPFHELSEALFSAHMTQHEILMLIAAPLIVSGRPQIAAVWAIAPSYRQRVGSIVKDRSFENCWHFVSSGLVAFLIHAAALWIWHIPVLFDATLKSDIVHALQHASFFGTALLFWWAIINGAVGWKSSFVGVLYLFITSLHSGVLGAFITFTRQLLYPVYFESTAAWGLTPLEDQQLGGLIMWVPGGLVYIGAGLFMFARLLRQSERHAFEYDRRTLNEAVTSDL
ncbi:MAG: hypothetical protein DMF62_12640 [Acidobacteria bacterium]|nr:MAG: hypothetical protein DMF62_12640 [Acidobacteriota bacterium]